MPSPCRRSGSSQRAGSVQECDIASAARRSPAGLVAPPRSSRTVPTLGAFLMRRTIPLLLLAFAACADGTSPTEKPNLARIQDAEDSHGGTPFTATLVPQTEVTPAGG